MALVSQSSSAVVSELQKSRYFNLALSLNTDIGSEALRALTRHKLGLCNTDLKTHLGSKNFVSKFKSKGLLFKSQIKLLSVPDPDLMEMDITLLTLVLLNTFTLSADEKKNITKLKDKRNQLAHAKSCQLEDEVFFNESRGIIDDICKGLNTADQEQIDGNIKKLQQRELLNKIQGRMLVRLRNEEIMTTLLDVDRTNKEKDEGFLLLKFGMSMSIRNIARCVEIDILLQELTSECVISENTKRCIDAEFSIEEQASKLILWMLDQSKETILRFCSCLRKRSPILADVIENSSSERNLEHELKLEEGKRIQQILSGALELSENKRVSWEDIHTFVDEKRKFSAQFTDIRKYVADMFDLDVHSTGDWVSGIGWTADIEHEFDANPIEEKVIDVQPADMDTDDFADYLGLQMELVRKGLLSVFHGVIREQSISADIFSKLSKPELKLTFEDALEGSGVCRYGLGIVKKLEEVQDTIRKHTQLRGAGSSSVLRMFGTPTGTLTYVKDTVHWGACDLLSTVHCFVHPSSKRELKLSYFAKKSVQFVAACINGRQNGTLHFGIKREGPTGGKIIGVSNTVCGNTDEINIELKRSLAQCFCRRQIKCVERCMRPVQAVPVSANEMVIELDVEAYSGFLPEEGLNIKYPPLGHQREKFFMYLQRPIPELETIAQSKVIAMQEDLDSLKDRRKDLEMKNTSCNRKASTRLSELRNRMTRGCKYITNEYHPIIICGNYSESCAKETILEHMSTLETAFVSSSAIFDFDPSAELIKVIERNDTYFDIKLAENTSKRLRTESTSIENTAARNWFYCNGNKETGSEQMDASDWFENRNEGVAGTLQSIIGAFPIQRIVFLFLIFVKLDRIDPLYEFTRQCLITNKESCFVIAECESFVQEIMGDLFGIIGKERVSRIFFTGFQWQQISISLATIFKQNPNTVCKLPRSDGCVAEMSAREKQECKFTDMEILSGEECEHEMSHTEMQDKKAVEKENFYKGNEVSWWNFFFETHVCKRQIIETHISTIKDMVEGSTNRFERIDICHHPGAGGTTLGKHILWYFGSFMHNHTSKAYRCAVLTNIRETETVLQIVKFREFKDNPDDANPVLILADNHSDQMMKILTKDLMEASYKYGSRSGKLFCLLIVVSRVSVSKQDPGEPVLKQHLNTKEQLWFEEKNKELQATSSIVNSMIAFNVMRENFSHKYIKETTARIMECLEPNEKKTLQHLALINTYDPDAAIPSCVFDTIMKNETSTPSRYNFQTCIDVGKPIGMVGVTKRENYDRKDSWQKNWNMNCSESLSLLIKDKQMHSSQTKGIMTISPLIASEILENIKVEREASLEELAEELLDIMGEQRLETNSLSKRFVKIICNLFKERHKQDSPKDSKLKFSALVLDLGKVFEEEDKQLANKRVVRLMQQCFDLSKDAYVGQQLARFNVHIHDYDAARNAIEKALEYKKTPHLYDTYGQVFKSNMEKMLEARQLDDADAGIVIKLAIGALDQFKKAQNQSTETEDDMGPFRMEVLTALQLIEKADKFECCRGSGDWDCFLDFINGSQTVKFTSLEPYILQFRKGHKTQDHFEESLRLLEYRDFMIKEVVYQVQTVSNERLLLDMRQRYERLYKEPDNHLCEFVYGPTIKSVMTAYKKDRNKLAIRADQAVNRLPKPDERDLLYFLGYKISELSTNRRPRMQTDDRHTHTCIKDFKLAQRLSTILVEMQHEKFSRQKRPYIEAYLYYAIFHWPLPIRVEYMPDVSFNVETFTNYIDEWQKCFDTTFHSDKSKKDTLLLRNRAKTFFALGNGIPGKDIVDTDQMRREWRRQKKKTGRMRREVLTDNIWSDPLGQKELQMIPGVVDDSGKHVIYSITLGEGRRNQSKIAVPIYHSRLDHLSNRSVTFVLGFSWCGPAAFGVKEPDQINRSPQVNRKDVACTNIAERDQQNVIGKRPPDKRDSSQLASLNVSHDVTKEREFNRVSDCKGQKKTMIETDKLIAESDALKGAVGMVPTYAETETVDDDNDEPWTLVKPKSHRPKKNPRKKRTT